MPKLTIVFFDAGGGHRNAANALSAAIPKQYKDWDVTLLNLQEFLDRLDPFLKVTGIRLQDLYNRMLERGLTLGSSYFLFVLHELIKVYGNKIVQALRPHWEETKPDLLVSVVPNFNRLLAQSLRLALPSVPFVTILTDIADYPPHFWIERESQYVICGSGHAVQQARVVGLSAERIFQTSGMILNPRFYELPQVDRIAEREKMGLARDVPTGMMLFGGYGASAMLDIVQRLDESEINLQLIAICGKNQGLEQRLRRLRTKKPLHVEGFTKEIPHFMHLSDFFIGKPGPGSLSEALAFKLPVIVQRNAWTLPQERYNTEWVRENKVGIVVPSFRKILPAVRELLEPANFAAYKKSAGRMGNTAIFEIPEILHGILEKGIKGS